MSAVQLRILHELVISTICNETIPIFPHRHLKVKCEKQFYETSGALKS